MLGLAVITLVIFAVLSNPKKIVMEISSHHASTGKRASAIHPIP